jgi:hypothetical protein
MDFRDAHNQNICITGYPTEKNPDLLRRIIEASSNPGDLVLDCYAGSGTTLAVADRLERTWIGIDNSPEAIRTTLQRFAVGTQPMGDFAASRQEGREANGSRAKSLQPTLFGEFENEPDPLKVAGTHTPILDFVLMSETHLAPLVAEVAAAWRRQWMSELVSISAKAAP